MNESLITIAPTLSDPNILVIYRNNSDEIVVKVNKETKSISSNKKLEENEVIFIREKYL